MKNTTTTTATASLLSDVTDVTLRRAVKALLEGTDFYLRRCYVVKSASERYYAEIRVTTGYRKYLKLSVSSAPKEKLEEKLNAFFQRVRKAAQEQKTACAIQAEQERRRDEEKKNAQIKWVRTLRAACGGDPNQPLPTSKKLTSFSDKSLLRAGEEGPLGWQQGITVPLPSYPEHRARYLVLLDAFIGRNLTR